jgi:hypothetical protein
MAYICIIKRTAESNSLFCVHKYFCGSALAVAYVSTVVMPVDSRQYFLMLHKNETYFEQY